MSISGEELASWLILLAASEAHIGLHPAKPDNATLLMQAFAE
jgi:hypothetical protein